jgi:hypothetical protein
MVQSIGHVHCNAKFIFEKFISFMHTTNSGTARPSQQKQNKCNQNMSCEFTVLVKRVESKNGTLERWVGKVDAFLFEAPTEEKLRELIAEHLKNIVSRDCGKEPTAFDARLRRTWQVRIVEKDESEDFNFDLFA